MPTETPTETEQAEMEEAARGQQTTPDPEPEVRPDEFTQGIERPVGESAWGEAVVEELRKPLDPNRVRRREGRGNTSLEYLAGHDVKRRLSEIFGFGQWGHRVKLLEEIAAEPVVSERDGNQREGWHVGYRVIVTLWVARDNGTTWETEGVGYGDGVEYTPAARIQAAELAMKEAETDALKRAATDLGDQFGLILYAKVDERRRIERGTAEQETTSSRRPVRVDPRPRPPQSWGEIVERFAKAVGAAADSEPEALAWMQETLYLMYSAVVPDVRKMAATDLKPTEAKFAGQMFASVVLLLEEMPDLAFDPEHREKVADAITSRFNGVKPEGPTWRLSPTETDREPWTPEEEQK